jgi:hypothetical protein
MAGSAAALPRSSSQKKQAGVRNLMALGVYRGWAAWCQDTIVTETAVSFRNTRQHFKIKHCLLGRQGGVRDELFLAWPAEVLGNMGWFKGEVSALRRWQPHQQRAAVALGTPNATNRFDRRTPCLGPGGFHFRCPAQE